MTGGEILIAAAALTGRILLAAAAVCLLLLLLILLVPIRYRAVVQVEDPNEHDSPDWEALKANTYAELRFSWLLHLIRGSCRWTEGLEMELKCLCFRLPPFADGHRRRRKKKRKQKKPEAPSQGSGGRGLSPDQTKELLRLLRKEGTGKSIRAILEKTGRILKILLPGKWRLEGTVGLGGPENTARFIEAEGILLPFVCGHVWILPQMEGYRMDIRGGAGGRISLARILFVIIVLLLDRNVQDLIASVQKIINRKEKKG